MVIEIRNDADLYAQQVALDCTEKPVVTLVKRMQKFYTTPPLTTPSLEIQINPDLLKDSYRANPAMLAKNGRTGCYTYEKGVYRNNLIVILYTNNSDEGVTFMRRLRDFLEGEGADGIATLQIPLEDVPETYRYRPEQIRWRIKTLMGIKLITRKTKTNWIYRRGK